MTGKEWEALHRKIADREDAKERHKRNQTILVLLGTGFAGAVIGYVLAILTVAVMAS